MGNIDSLNLFDLDELMIFSFYYRNRGKYQKVLDLGANLGLHSILLSKCGFNVCCYEPDPAHFQILKNNLALNAVENVQAFNVAVSTQAGETQFIRVLGNTTGSHISGAKQNLYGDLEHFTVPTVDFKSMLSEVDLIKMDIEGHEKNVLLSLTRKDWNNIDAFVEIENAENGRAVFEHLQKLDLPIYAQKINWRRVQKPEELPCGHREGSAFISGSGREPWM
jgi:FkbM family methyltransferase